MDASPTILYQPNMEQSSGMKPRQSKAEERANRLKAALKANIARRKAQARARSTGAAEDESDADIDCVPTATGLDDAAPIDGNENGQEQADGFDSGKR
jgi:hypothetical protein